MEIYYFFNVFISWINRGSTEVCEIKCGTFFLFSDGLWYTILTAVTKQRYLFACNDKRNKSYKK
jgi:hypothetical protein